MELGWIDFSKNERNKVLNVLDLLGEQGVLDELGIATIRDGFSDLLFPGTSTIQTRAKYFLIVPYILKDLEMGDEINPKKLIDDLDRMEEDCAKQLYIKHPNELGIIGKNSIMQDSWVKRPPSNVYLAGLRKYGIFNFKSFTHYFKFISSKKQARRNIANQGNHADENEGHHDDKNAGIDSFSNFLNIPIYHKKWEQTLEINLTPEEGQFLKNQIILNCSESMLAFILKKDMYEILEFDSIRDIREIIFKFPSRIQDEYNVAMSFSEFVYTLRVLYNVIVSNGNNIKAVETFKTLENNFEDIADIDFNDIMFRLKIKNPQLKSFLELSKQFMLNKDVEGLSQHLIRREMLLKGKNRARLCHPGEFDYDLWFAGERLNYRFDNLKVILRDIFKSEGVI